MVEFTTAVLGMSAGRTTRHHPARPLHRSTRSTVAKGQILHRAPRIGIGSVVWMFRPSVARIWKQYLRVGSTGTRMVRCRLATSTMVSIRSPATTTAKSRSLSACQVSSTWLPWSSGGARLSPTVCGPADGDAGVGVRATGGGPDGSSGLSCTKSIGTAVSPKMTTTKPASNAARRRKCLGPDRVDGSPLPVEKTRVRLAGAGTAPLRGALSVDTDGSRRVAGVRGA